jgi:hypothetical protein
MDKFIDMYDSPKLKQEDINNLSRSVMSNEIETEIKNILTNKIPGPNGFTAEFCKTFKEELILTLLKLSKTILSEGILPNSFYKAYVSLITRSGKDTHTHRKRKL